MKEKDKNKTESSEMLRYFNGEMTGRERNAFERKLHKDLFSAEAEEGLSGLSGDQLKTDLSQLDRRLKSRVARKSTIVFYRIAASVAVLLVLSSVFIVLNRKNQSEKQSEIAYQPVTMDISKSEVLKETPEVTEQADIKGITDTVEEKRAEAPTDILVTEEVLHDNEAQAVMADKSDIPEKIIAAQPLDRPIEMLAVRQNVAAMPLTAAGEPAGTAIKKTMDTREKKGEMIAEDSMISGLDEVVVVGYGNEQKAEDAFAGYSSPVPVGGKPAFESYISSNIRNPSSLAEGERAVVIVSIMVKNTGAIDSIKVVRSPGKEFSDEAIRLIKEGPAWNPATENGEKTDDEVRIRIVFK